MKTTSHFLADDLAITAQGYMFNDVEQTLTHAYVGEIG